jgi:exonuclease III
MKLLSWNCRGLGKASAVRALRQLILNHHPDIVFLTETKFQNSDFRKKTNSFGHHLPNLFVVDCNITQNNRRGGLAMMWANNVNLQIIGNNENMIDCYVVCGNIESSWRATGFYGYPKNHQKALTCDLISNLNHNNTHENWLLFGDFNLILNSNEKQGVEILITISLT